jgi:hypothetical protein
MRTREIRIEGVAEAVDHCLKVCGIPLLVVGPAVIHPDTWRTRASTEDVDPD